jgi:hypothetical protein
LKRSSIQPPYPARISQSCAEQHLRDCNFVVDLVTVQSLEANRLQKNCI